MAKFYTWRSQGGVPQLPHAEKLCCNRNLNFSFRFWVIGILDTFCNKFERISLNGEIRVHFGFGALTFPKYLTTPQTQADLRHKRTQAGHSGGLRRTWPELL